MRLWLVAGMLGSVIAGLPGRATAGEVTIETRDRIEEKLSNAFLAPQTTLWQFDAELPYVSGERVVCGWVNFQSAQQKYVGFHQFYAIVADGLVTLAQIDDPVSDTSGELANKLNTLCGTFKRPG